MSSFSQADNYAVVMKVDLMKLRAAIVKSIITLDKLWAVPVRICRGTREDMQGYL